VTNEPDLEEDDVPRESTLRRLENVGGYSTVFQAGSSPCFILKEASTMPRVINLRGGPVQSLTDFHTAGCDRGFAYIDADVSEMLEFAISDDADKLLGDGSDMSITTALSLRGYRMGDSKSKHARRGSSNMLLCTKRNLRSGHK
jgi:hypothetical protein